MQPFIVNDETKAMVVDNICHLLNSYLKCNVYKNIVFCWVIDEQNILDEITSKLKLSNVNVRVFTLMANKDSLVHRIDKDIKDGKRSTDVISRSIAKLQKYNTLNSTKINTNTKSLKDITVEILNHLN